MKKLFLQLMAASIAACTFTACEDVPEPYNNPYDNPTGGGGGGTTGTLPYTSNNLNSGWTLQNVTEEQPWSQGSSYVQATGYQAWDGESAKSNRAVEGWLISPSFNTTDAEQVKISFDYTLRYTNNVSGWAANHKIYVSNSYDGTTFDASQWTEVPFTAVASPYNDWTLYPSGEIQLPASIAAGQEKVYVGFWFQAPANASTTWELKNFKIEAGEATATPDDPSTPDTPGEAKGSGTLEDPFNAVAATQEALKLSSGQTSEQSYYIKGKVAEIKYNYGDGKYPKTADYYISDDGTSSNTFYVYASKYLGNTDYASGTVLKEGDEVIIYGQLQNYNGTAETATNKSFLYSLNGVTQGGVTPDNPTPTPTGEAKGSGTQADPFNVQAIINYVSSLDADVDTKQDYYVKGIVTQIPTGNNGISTQYNSASFYISDDASGSNKFYVFRAKGLNGGDVTENMLKVGDEVVIFGSTWVNYKGNTPETKQGEAYIVSITSGGDNTGGNTTPGGEVSGNTLTVTMGSLGLENASDLATLTLSDGTTLTFAQNGGTNGPKYYNTGTAARLYPGISVTISSSKTIASVVLTCSTYNAEGNVSAQPGTVSVSDMTVSIAQVNSKSTTITNTHTGTGQPSQLRIATIAITYAE